jgi:hypothetical protein
VPEGVLDEDPGSWLQEIGHDQRSFAPRACQLNDHVVLRAMKNFCYLLSAAS